MGNFKDDFIATVAPLVVKHGGPLFPSISIAQACLESKFGTSRLAQRADNLFGIKASDPWKGPSISQDSDEEDDQGEVAKKKSYFRKYKDWEESIKDHAGFLESTNWRKKTYASVLSATTPEDQAKALTRTYATDSGYGAKLINLINQYNLKQYDQPKPLNQGGNTMPTMYPIVKDLTTVNHGGWGNTKEWLVIHFVGAAGQAKDNANYFRSTYREASAHYFVDPNNIIQVVEDDQKAWHIGDGYYSGRGSYNGYIGYGATNNNAIGIEMCQDTSTGSNAYEWQIAQKTYEQTLLLAAHLMRKYNIPFDHVIRHFDASGKNCPGCWNDGGKWTMWWKFKSDLKQLLNGGNIPEAKAEVEKVRYSEKTVNWENWTGTVTVDALNVRNAPNTNGSPVAQYGRGDVIHFDGWLWANGYRWGTYVSYSGVRRYVAYGEINGANYMSW